MVHVLFVAGAVVHIDELILVVFRAASAGGWTRGRTVLIAGFARFALLLLHALVLGAPILEPDFDLEEKGGKWSLDSGVLNDGVLKDGKGFQPLESIFVQQSGDNFVGNESVVPFFILRRAL